MECRNDKCTNAVESKGNRVKEFCSDRCRMQFKRSKANTESEQIQTEQPKANTAEVWKEIGKVTSGGDSITLIPASLEHYQANPDMYATRANPNLLNWGDWMNAKQLAEAGLKANRVCVPGDWDYDGVCEQVDGQWTTPRQRATTRNHPAEAITFEDEIVRRQYTSLTSSQTQQEAINHA